MITIQEGHMVPLPFGSFTDPETAGSGSGW